MNKLEGAINKIKVKESEENIWIGSKYEDVKILSNDGVGDVGEELIYEIVKDKFEEVKWDGTENTNQEDGVYDIKINGKRIEVKTATLGVNKGFQHENLYSQDKCDFVLFVSICPNNVYLTMLDMSNTVLGVKHPDFGVSATLRNDQTDKFKFDFSLGSLIKKYVPREFSIEYNNNEEKIINFLEKYV